METRRFGRSGREVPAIGLGTWQTFDVGPEGESGAQEVVEIVWEGGTRVFDSSPMYGRAERVVGDVIAAGVDRDKLFLATKVWTDGKMAGYRQMERSFELMQTEVMDLMQVHNRRDLATHMETIREWQAQKRIRYSGVTDYRESALDDMEAVMRQYRPNFIQINYSLGEHGADDRVLPAAQDSGIAVVANRPFMGGALFRAVRGQALPGWAKEFAASWGQFFLKFILGHPAVTCVIPGTAKPDHARDNVAAGFGRLPDAAQRKRMVQFWEGL